MLRNEISDAEFEAAWNNSDNRNIIYKVTSGYSNVLSADDLECCAMQAMWRCLKSHDPSYNQKFITSLYRFVCWECNRELQKQLGSPTKRAHVVEPIYEDSCSYEAEEQNNLYNPFNVDIKHIKAHIKYLANEERRVVSQYFFKYMTQKEIGEKNGYSKETARKKISRAVARLKELCGEK